jgi:hypothetical protein
VTYREHPAAITILFTIYDLLPIPKPAHSESHRVLLRNKVYLSPSPYIISALNLEYNHNLNRFTSSLVVFFLCWLGFGSIFRGSSLENQFDGDSAVEFINLVMSLKSSFNTLSVLLKSLEERKGAVERDGVEKLMLWFLLTYRL